jgi:hypothetical protein
MENNPMKYRLNSQSSEWFRIFNLLTELVFTLKLHISLKYSIIEHYDLKLMFLQIENSDKVIILNAQLIPRVEHCNGHTSFLQSCLQSGSYMFLSNSHVKH